MYISVYFPDIFTTLSQKTNYKLFGRNKERKKKKLKNSSFIENSTISVRGANQITIKSFMKAHKIHFYIDVFCSQIFKKRLLQMVKQLLK